MRGILLALGRFGRGDSWPRSRRSERRPHRNTLILTDSADNQTAYLLDADGRFTETPMTASSHGAWTLKDGRLCVTPEGQSTAAADGRRSDQEKHDHESQRRTVLVTYAKQGEVVQARQPLYKVADMGTVDVRAYVSEPQLADVKVARRRASRSTPATRQTLNAPCRGSRRRRSSRPRRFRHATNAPTWSTR